MQIAACNHCQMSQSLDGPQQHDTKNKEGAHAVAAARGRGRCFRRARQRSQQRSGQGGAAAAARGRRCAARVGLPRARGGLTHTQCLQERGDPLLSFLRALSRVAWTDSSLAPHTVTGNSEA